MLKNRKNKATKDIQWSFISLVSSSVSHLLLRIFLSNELGPTGLGIYTLVFTIYLFWMQFAAFGIGSALTKYLSEYIDSKDKVDELISCGMLGSLIIGSIIGAFIYTFSSMISLYFFHSPEMIPLLKIVSICFPFISVQKNVLGTLNGLFKIRCFAIIEITQNLLILVTSLLLVLIFKMSLIGSIIGFVIPTIFVSLFSVYFVRKNLKKPKKFKLEIKELLRFGLYTVLANSAAMLSTQIDSLMIGYFINETKVGYYSIAIILVQGLTLIPDSLQRVTYPIMSNYYGKNNYEEIIKIIKKIAIETFLVTVLISILLVFFGKFLICLLFGEEFLSGYKPLLILLIGYSIYTPSRSIGGALSSVGEVNVMFKISYLSVIINTILNIIFIPKYDILGASIATSISLILTSFMRYYFIIKYIFNKNHNNLDNKHNMVYQ